MSFPSGPDVTMVELLAPYWSWARVREALGLSEAELETRCAENALLALPVDDSEPIFPLLQFQRQPAGAVEPRPKVVDLVAKLSADLQPWTIGVLLRTGAPELDGMTPERWLAEGGSEEDLAVFVAMVLAEFRR